MRVILCTQYYRAQDDKRQKEIDTCLRLNTNNLEIDKVIIFAEAGSPEIVTGQVAHEVVPINRRLRYSDWIRMASKEEDAIIMVANSDIYPLFTRQQLLATLSEPSDGLALTRRNWDPERNQGVLNLQPQWTQDLWAIRSDAEIGQSLMDSTTFPLGVPGCDNRISHVLWTHGFQLKNPAYHLATIHLQAISEREYDMGKDRLYGGSTYVYPSLSAEALSSLDHTVWSKALEQPTGMSVNLQDSGGRSETFVPNNEIKPTNYLEHPLVTQLQWSYQSLGTEDISIWNQSWEPIEAAVPAADLIPIRLVDLLDQELTIDFGGDRHIQAAFLKLPPSSGPTDLVVFLEYRRDGQWLRCNEGLWIQEHETSRRHHLCFDGRVPERCDRLRLRLRRNPSTYGAEPGTEIVELMLLGEARDSPAESAHSENNQAGRVELRRQEEDWRQEIRCQKVASLGLRLPSSIKILQTYSKRFEILEVDTNIVCIDFYWPEAQLGTEKLRRALTEGDAEAVFSEAFVRPVMEWRKGFIKIFKTHAEALHFWQYPCKTEQDALEIHRMLRHTARDRDTYHIYIGLPWATYLDKNTIPKDLIDAYAGKVAAIREILANFNRKLCIHTVCQHDRWKELLPLLNKLGISDLWISQCTQDQINDRLQTTNGDSSSAQVLRLHAWPLFAVNAIDPERKQGLLFNPVTTRHIKASFIGAYQKGYLSQIRRRLLNLSNLEGYEISLNDRWHFEDIVYKQQVSTLQPIQNDGLEAEELEQVRRYNELLSTSIFSLCPSGSGPNSIRFWESLAAGAIPVLLSDFCALPDLERMAPALARDWQDAVIIHSESELHFLPARLAQIDARELEQRQALCRKLFEASRSLTCFGSVRRATEPIAQPILYFYPQQIQIPGASSKTFDGIGHQQQMITPVAIDRTTVRDLHLRQTEKLIEIKIELESCTFRDIEFSVDHYLEHDKFMHLFDHRLATKPDGSSLEFHPHSSQILWANGLRLSCRWRLGHVHVPTAQLKLTIIIEKDAFAKQANHFENQGIIQSLSKDNSKRHDDCFDSHSIERADIFKQFASLAGTRNLSKGEPLFPTKSTTTHNLIGELIGDGTTMYIHLMNRNYNVIRNLANWLAQDFDELILLDWSSHEPVATIPGIFDDKRLRIIRVERQETFIRTIAQNLASRMARNRKIMKCDSDVEFKGNFFAAHPLFPGEFWVGDWHHARDMNERHLHGNTYYHIDDFLRVNGYDERIYNYGQDDTNLKDRMVLASLSKRVFNLNFINHQQHDHTQRVQNQRLPHPLVMGFANRLMCNCTEIWSPEMQFTNCELIDKRSDSELVIEATVDKTLHTDTTKFEDEAIDIVAGWHMSGTMLRSLSREEKLAVIWQKHTQD